MDALQALFASPWGPVVIGLLRVADVSLATVRMMLIMRGVRWLVPLIAFAEVLVWVLAAGSAIRNLQSGWHLIGYAGGFAAGNVVGMWVEEKLAFGFVCIRVVSTDPSIEVADALRRQGFGVTQFFARGKDGEVEVLFSVIRRRDLPATLALVRETDPKAFITVEETKTVLRGWLFSDRRK